MQEQCACDTRPLVGCKRFEQCTEPAGLRQRVVVEQHDHIAASTGSASIDGTDEPRPRSQPHVLDAGHAGEHLRPVERAPVIDDDELERVIHARGAGRLQALQRQLELLVEGDDDRRVEPALGAPGQAAQWWNRVHAAATEPTAGAASQGAPEDRAARVGEAGFERRGRSRCRGALGDHLLERVDTDVGTQGASHDDRLLVAVHAMGGPGAAQHVLGTGGGPALARSLRCAPVVGAR